MIKFPWSKKKQAGDGPIVGLMCTLKIEEKTALFILLANDGLVNRMGTGSLDNPEYDLFIGKAKEPLFDQAVRALTPELMHWMGESREAHNPQGPRCELSVGLKRRSGTEVGTAWRYGAESQGPPEEVCEFVRVMAQLTSAWYESEKAGSQKTDL